MSDHHVRPPSRGERDPQTGNLQSRSSSRDMSWRKPVPKFIPSPPISPNQTQSLQSAGSPFECTWDSTNPFSASFASLKNDSLPPLPTDWKENIDRVVRNESTTNLRTPLVSPVVTSPIRGFARGYYQDSVTQILEKEKDLPVFQEVDLGEVRSRRHLDSEDKENIPPSSWNPGVKRLGVSLGANESTVSVARIPKTYRPPTPPLPSRKRTSAPSTPVTATMNKPMHIVYPDLVGLGAESDDEHTLRTVKSSLTTCKSHRGVSADASTLADDDDRTLPVYQQPSARKSSAVSKTTLFVDTQIQSPGIWRSLGLWFDSFSGSFKSCLSGY